MRQENPWLVTIAVTVGTLMGALDTSIVNVAMPYIRANLGATVTEVTWISTGYIIALVIIMPLTAWLGATFGRKRVYMSCLVLFTVASFFCGSARSLMSLLVFRVIQGAGAGALQPTEQAILRETFPAEKQAMAMSLYGLAVMIGPAIGPTLGGWITDNYNWPWIFYVNVPVGIAGLWMVNRFVHDPPHAKVQRGKAGVDFVGIGLLAVGLASLQTVLEEGETNDWFNSPMIAGLTFIAVVTLATFLWWERRVEKPVVDLSVLKNPSFTTGTVIGGVLGVSLYASLFLLPLFMQELLQYPATKSGLVLMPRSLIMILLMPVAGALYNPLGPKIMVGAGLLVAGAAPIMMSHFSLDTGGMSLFWPQVVQGMGFVMIFVALSTASLSGIERTKMTSATGLYNLVRQLGGSFGTAIFATLLSRTTQTGHAVLAERVNEFNPAFMTRLQQLQQAFVSRGIDPWAAKQKAMAVIEGSISQQAAVLAFERAFFLIGALFFVCFPLVLLLKAAPRGGSVAQHPEPVEV
ncbi:MAG TPA: DHA2 family efflux MFS transporter permease subunit [Armatimonadota bacterium]|jgi:DHA2 family multidrug resistance protein